LTVPPTAIVRRLFTRASQPSNFNSRNAIREHLRVLDATAFALPYPGHQSATWRGADTMTIKIVPNDKGNPPGKLADAEVHFTQGPLEGLKLIGFAVWERKTGNGRNVTFPARQYSVGGERRSYALLRPVADATAQNQIRDLILQAFAEHEAEAAIAS
jgi:hypothetical protein